MEILYEDPALRIAFEGGYGDEIVVAFTGARQGFGGIDKDDFVKTNHIMRFTRDAYFINDRKRSWYNGIYSQILHILKPRLEGRSVVTLGNSLGGFGALLYSGILPQCRAALAFVPQYSVSPKIVPAETRWNTFRSGIGIFGIESCFLPGVSYEHCRKIIVYGVDEQRDMSHAKLMYAAADNNTIFLFVGGCGHDVTFEIKKAGGLSRFVDEALSLDCSQERLAGILADCEMHCSAIPPW